MHFLTEYREKLSNNPSVEMTNDVPRYIATLTEGFSFAYIKEAYIGTFLALIQEIADEESSGAKDGGKYGRLGDLLEKHVGLLKVEMSEISRDDSKEKK
jgi:hypothetical protein